MPRTRLTTLPFRRKPVIEFCQWQPSRHRTFAHRSSLLLVARPLPRPQLPFLHPSTSSSSSTSSPNIALIARSNNLLSLPTSSQLGRFISTESKARWKARLWWQLRFHAYFWPTALLVVLLAAGIHQTKLERDYPTPREWTFLSRWYLRTAHYTETDDEAKINRVLTDWSKVGYYYQLLLDRLENEQIDGKSLLNQDEGGILVAGIGHTGFDISTKSEQWRRGYYDALMGAARTAENLEGMCKRKGEKRGKLYPKESIPGPTNPRPKPLPWDRNGGHENVPKAEEVEDAFLEPEVFYMRVLTTKGLDNGQRVEAALAFADWCDFKGLSETALSMYEWALDIATSTLPLGSSVVEPRTGVIAVGKEGLVSQNILKATTGLGVHYAKQKDVKRALPIFLSILKARKSLPAMPAGMEPKARFKEDEGLWSYLYAMKDLVIEAPYPDPPPSGDDRPYHTLQEACEEVGLMLYIGEILFATGGKEREKGLSWTRDSVEAAEAILWVMDEQKSDQGRGRCRECLGIGLENWKSMTKQMTLAARKKAEESKESTGWLGTGIGKEKSIEKSNNDIERWSEEESQIELRKQKTMPLIQTLKPPKRGWI